MANVQTDLTKIFVAKVQEFKASSMYGYSSQSERSIYVLGLFKGFLACTQSAVHIDDLVFQHSLIQNEMSAECELKVV